MPDHELAGLPTGGASQHDAQCEFRVYEYETCHCRERALEARVATQERTIAINVREYLALEAQLAACQRQDETHWKTRNTLLKELAACSQNLTLCQSIAARSNMNMSEMAMHVLFIELREVFKAP